MILAVYLWMVARVPMGYANVSISNYSLDIFAALLQYIKIMMAFIARVLPFVDSLKAE